MLTTRKLVGYSWIHFHISVGFAKLCWCVLDFVRVYNCVKMFEQLVDIVTDIVTDIVIDIVIDIGRY